MCATFMSFYIFFYYQLNSVKKIQTHGAVFNCETIKKAEVRALKLLDKEFCGKFLVRLGFFVCYPFK
jgi:hypothetical protein